jgi:hypothetical protein
MSCMYKPKRAIAAPSALLLSREVRLVRVRRAASALLAGACVCHRVRQHLYAKSNRRGVIILPAGRAPHEQVLPLGA